MITSKNPGGQTVYQVKVTLKGIRPPIWRRFLTLSDISLYRLHEILQVVMGWTNSHLYQFDTGKAHFGEPDPEHGMEMRDAKRAKLNQVAPKEKLKFVYEYDFGDTWLHEILVEAILPAEPGVQYPVCLSGRRACPPEDCGGIGGYAHLLDVIQDPDHEELEEMTEWLGGGLDAERFDLDEVNKTLRSYVRVGTARSRVKIGRNDPCPCGSGRKYKKCCGRVTEPLALPDRRLMERDLRSIQKLVEGKDFKSAEELNAFLRETTAKGEIPEWKLETPLEQAQELVYQALEATDKKERIRLAMDALKICQDCTEAYVLLAEEAAEIPEQARDWYRRGVEAGERVLGHELFTEEAGHFWGVVETRPYMRAREGLAECLFLLGEYDAAIEHFRDMLRLNPNDNQGVRYKVLSCLVEKGDIDGAEELLKQFEDEVSAAWLFTHALVTFTRQGDVSRARQQLTQATKQNPHVVPYLVGQRRLPRTLPDYVGLGDESEAVAYMAEFGATWLDTPGAVEWVRLVTRSRE